MLSFDFVQRALLEIMLLSVGLGLLTILVNLRDLECWVQALACSFHGRSYRNSAWSSVALDHFNWHACSFAVSKN